MALGAQSHDVLKLVMSEGITLALIGVGLGLLVVSASSRVMKSLLFGVSATDTLTLVSVAVLLTLVALGACWIPARRATKVDPLMALRYE
jgi:ABC-type antimicrobial peptide transport system permease subunit